MARREYKYAGKREKDEEISAKKNIITYKYRDFLSKNITKKKKMRNFEHKMLQVKF